MSQYQNFTEERLFGERETTKYDKEHRKKRNKQKKTKIKQTKQTAKTNKKNADVWNDL